MNMKVNKSVNRLVFIVLALFLQACTVVKIVDVAASTTVGVASGAVKATGAVVGAAIPDGDDESDEE